MFNEIRTYLSNENRRYYTLNAFKCVLYPFYPLIVGFSIKYRKMSLNCE